jgi:hypothetical protein
LARELDSLYLSHFDVGRLGALFQIRHAQPFGANQVAEVCEPALLLVRTRFDFAQSRKVELHLPPDVEKRVLGSRDQATHFP